MIEEWKAIPGYISYYEASSLGRIRSVARVVTTYSARGGRSVPMRRRGRVMRLNINKRTGYLSVCLSRDGKCKTKRVNVLVCMTFNGPCRADLICCHNDGEKLNNTPENLRWDTTLANQADRVVHGTDLRGESVGTSKITAEQAAAIFAGMTRKEARTRLSIGFSQFYRIKRGMSWAHIGAEHSVRFSAPADEELPA